MESHVREGGNKRGLPRRDMLKISIGALLIGIIELKTPLDITDEGILFRGTPVERQMKEGLYKKAYELESKAVEALLSPGVGVIGLLRRVTETSAEAMNGIGSAISSVQDTVTQNDKWVTPVVEHVVFFDGALRKVVSLIETGEQIANQGIGPLNTPNIKRAANMVPPLRPFVDVWSQIVDEGKNRLNQAAVRVDQFEEAITARGSGLLDRVGSLTVVAVDPLKKSSLFWGGFLEDASGVLGSFETGFNTASDLHQKAKELVRQSATTEET